jgi:iron complex outermembrane receptor protein
MRVLGFGAILLSILVAEGRAVAGADELIVTAQRRAEPLQRVPMAVSLFTPRMLDDLGNPTSLAFAATVPNLAAGAVPGPGSINGLFVRGLGSLDSVPTQDPSVGVFVDEVLLPRPGAAGFAFFDVARLEVLRGPQGTLLGRGASAGAVNIVLKAPGERFAGFVEGGYGSYDRKLVRGSLDLPVASILSVKLTGFYQDDDGRASNSTTGQRTNDEDMAGLRLAAQMRPAPDLTFDVALSYVETNGENLADFDCDPADASRCRGRFVTTGLSTTRRLGGVPQYALPVTGVKAGFPLGNRTATTLLTSNLGWAGEHVRLNIITGFSDVSERQALDYADGRGLPDLAQPEPPVRGFRDGGYTILNEATHQMLSQEVKLSGDLAGGRLSWVVGALVSRSESRTDTADLETLETGTAAGAPRLLADRVLWHETQSAAGYAQVDVRPLEAVRLTAGIRYSDEEKRLSIRDNRAVCVADPGAAGCFRDGLVAATGVTVPQRLDTAQWTPRLAVCLLYTSDAADDM